MKCKLTLPPAAGLAALSLAGCGYSPGSRALSGSGGGAIGGAVTSPNTVNFGRQLVGN